MYGQRFSYMTATRHQITLGAGDEAKSRVDEGSQLAQDLVGKPYTTGLRFIETL